MKAERATVFAKMKFEIKLYVFKTSNFKGILLTRTKHGNKKADGSAPTKRAYKKKASNLQGRFKRLHF